MMTGDCRGDMGKGRHGTARARSAIGKQGPVYGMLAAPDARGELALKAVRVLAVVVQYAAHPRKRRKAFVSRPGGRGQFSGECSNRLQMDG
jgi:hypothetical protein